MITIVVKEGDRIAQLIIEKIHTPDVLEVQINTVALALDRQRWYLHSSVQTTLTSAQRLTALYGYGRMLSSARHLRDVSLF